MDPFIELAYGVLDDGDLVDSSPALSDGNHTDWDGAGEDRVKAAALRLWTFEGGRNPGKVRKLLLERSGVDVSAAVIRRWALEEDWESAGVRLHQAFSFSSSQAIRAQIDASSVRAIGVLDELMMREDVPPSARIKAASQVLGVAGYVPVPAQMSSVSVAVNMSRDTLASATDAELADMVEAYRDDSDHAVSAAPEPTDVEYRLARTESAATHSAAGHPYRRDLT